MVKQALSVVMDILNQVADEEGALRHLLFKSISMFLRKMMPPFHQDRVCRLASEGPSASTCSFNDMMMMDCGPQMGGGGTFAA
ncbi:hypothetical protein Pcinc_039460 [Petrolisthes cinctipes]|uniref:Uncharacterized protein n=1 Tax=Petrolisthes cinctipes TaxID=88211 RepID=A0AAE1BSC6_PETCI|nr:hypothetical protein Pcinc_039460 [Petrolisthes cinctipes]